MIATISPRASLFLLPSPVTCFEHSSYSQHQTFHLLDPKSSSLLLLDWFTSGRLSRGESWAFDKYRSVNEVYIAGKRIINDILLLEDGAEKIRPRMGPYSCYCTLVMYGQVLADAGSHFRQLTQNLTQYKRNQPEEGVLWSFSEIEAGQCGIARCAGTDVEALKDWLQDQLVCLKPVLGRDIYRAAFI